MTGLDTNVLVRYLTQDDPAQSRVAARALAEIASRGESCRLDAVVLCELIWVLESAYAFDRAAIAGAMERLLQAAQFSFDDKDLVRAAVAAYRDGRADFADELIGLRNLRAGCSITLTFDRKLRGSPGFSLLRT